MIPDTISEAALTRFVTRALLGLGFCGDDAALAANVVVEADLRGVDSHGVRVFAGRAREIIAGLIDPAALPQLLNQTAAMATFDGHHGYAPVLCGRVIRTATALAAEYGIGIVFLKNSSHWGCPAYYSRWMAKQGCIGIGLTNTHPAMPLWGSSAPSIGNNPLTIAAPRRAAEPIVLDMAMQQIAWGRLRLEAERGRHLPGQWGYDTIGEPTDDPAEIIKSNRVRPMGDHKGSALAFMIEILTGVLSSGLIGSEIARRMEAGQPVDYSQTFIAIRADGAMPIEHYYDQVEQLYQLAKRAPLAEGFDEILLPGDRSNACMERRRQLGIPVAPLRAAIEQIAADCALPLPWADGIA